MNSDSIQIKSFDELTKDELYSIIALRMQVFCVEQNCPYQDLDNLDQGSTHVFFKDDTYISAYARIIQDGAICHIGRVVVNPDYRSKGLATSLMESCLEHIVANNMGTVIISAQSYLQNFYKKLGFKNTGKYYLEDDIPHEEMELIG